TITQTMPVGSSLSATDAAAEKVERVLADEENIETYQLTIGQSESSGFTGGGSDSQASYQMTTASGIDQTAYIDDLRKRLDTLDGVGELVVAGAESGGMGSSEVEVIVSASDQDVLRRAADQVATAVKTVDGATDVTNNLAADQPSLQVTPDRAKAAKLGLSEAQIGQAVRAAFEGTDAGQVMLGGDQQQVRITTGDAPGDIGAVRDLPLPTPTGDQVKVSDVA